MCVCSLSLFKDREKMVGKIDCGVMCDMVIWWMCNVVIVIWWMFDMVDV